MVKMKKGILLVTGRNASQAVEEYAGKFPVRIHSCSENVAALLSAKGILEELSGENLDGISMIIVPGAVRGDVSVIQEKLGIPAWKGPRNLVDLPFVLEKVSSGMELSAKIPADEILGDEIKKEIEKELDRAYKPDKFSMKIGEKIFLGSGISHVIAEIPDAPMLNKEDIQRIAGYYEESGAEIIDIGMVAGEDNSAKVAEIVGAVRDSTDLPVAIDSLQEREILAAVDARVDLVLSLDLTNYEISDSLDVPAVIIPRDENGKLPKNVDDRIKILENLMGKVENFIVDPVLEPPNLGLVGSLGSYVRFRDEYPDVPMLMGAGNVTELMDADSPGINALLASMASELEIDLLFTTEASKKTFGAVRELSTAVKMAYLAKARKQAPKDLGISLLMLKDKKEVPQVDAQRFDAIKPIDVKEGEESGIDTFEFRVYLEDGKINIIYLRGNDPGLRFRGTRAKDLYIEITKRGLVENAEHAAYLGRELTKAEIALVLGKNYMQDSALF
ncbi:MAG: dihydropteroate synthase-like protein [Candidatus Altiarchaeales archaeon]|nr:dihydropteroate synthase-like protein [Candidatus Altiarchaeota archaeon]MCG2782373.1 dihydropteroate synthase-like protein [Candidatus Altiarchaeales archaeon]